MTNVKVRVTSAVVDGNAHGSVIEIDAKSAEHLVSLGYVELVVEVSKPVAKAESAPTNAVKPEAKPKPQRKATKDSK